MVPSLGRFTNTVNAFINPRTMSDFLFLLFVSFDKLYFSRNFSTLYKFIGIKFSDFFIVCADGHDTPLSFVISFMCVFFHYYQYHRHFINFIELFERLILNLLILSNIHLFSSFFLSFCLYLYNLSHPIFWV